MLSDPKGNDMEVKLGPDSSCVERVEGLNSQVGHFRKKIGGFQLINAVRVFNTHNRDFLIKSGIGDEF